MSGVDIPGERMPAADPMEIADLFY